MIQKTMSGQEPVAVHAFEVTPDLLREWAARLESKVTAPGQVVRMLITQSTELYYNPVDKHRHSEGRSNALIPTRP